MAALMKQREERLEQQNADKPSPQNIFAAGRANGPPGTSAMIGAQRPNEEGQGDSGLGPPEVDPEEIEIEEEIGVGSFGKVFRGRCRQKPVAVKLLHKQNFDKRTLLAFRREVKIMSKIFHPNICLFMGACLVPGKCMMITELLPKGDLETMLHDPKITIGIVTRMKMARDAALGMNWLHCSNPVFIHRDLKSSNLLVDNNMNVKVCDFGLSQLIPRDQKVKDRQNAKGTPLWMAPEVMMFQEFNEKCDVYSFGIVLWELLTRQEPFSQYHSFDKFKEAVCTKKERPPIPPETVPSLRDLINLCWAPDQNTRPSFKDIINALDFIIVDCAIRDERGNSFWKANFLKREDIAWLEFLDKFIPYVGLADDHQRDNNIRALRALLVESKKDDGIEIVSIEQFGKVLDWFAIGNTAEERDPRQTETIFDRVRELLSKSWFHGEISTQEANQKLNALPVAGAYLVRFSSTHPGSYTISSMPNQGGPVKHQRVSYVPGQGFVLNGVTRQSLEEVIGDSDTLMIPCPGSKYQSLFADQSVDLMGYA
eukprot:TRINITY_DN1454_c0_g1_i1.p1 TRINITY_DN1454_c0_g1~~TRINITY_DN1454_c0_g1_i1.p1  ORF type:complete len:539 (+),score=132.21 TRINITY_DN1454_c0_g1_i1:174-1790(+)